MKKRKVAILPVLYLIFGIYLVNMAFPFMVVPSFVLKANNFIVGFGGVLLLIATVRSIIYSKKRILNKVARQ